MKQTLHLGSTWCDITVDHEYSAKVRCILRRATADRELVKNTLRIFGDLRVHTNLERLGEVRDVMEHWREKLSNLNGLISVIRQRPVKTVATLTFNGKTWSAFAKCSKDDFKAGKSSKRLGMSAALKNLLRKCAEENILSPEQRRQLYQQLEQFIR